jgi:hypothetical protein
MRGDALAMATVRGVRPPIRGAAHYYPCLPHHSSRLAPADGIALGLELLGHAATARAMPRLRCNRFDPSRQLAPMPINGRGGVALQIRVKPAPTDLAHFTKDGHRPGLPILHHKGVAHFSSLTKKRIAFCTIARSIFSRLFSARNWRSSSWSGVRCPLPGNAAVFAVYSYFHRRSICTLMPRFRAVSATP